MIQETKQREIKFRGWDNGMFENVIIDGNVWCADLVMDVWHSGPIMQYTGLKDKNNKDIYEGDIVSRGAIKKAVKWITAKSQCGFNIGKGYNYHNSKTDTTIVVLGNIYENPGLLKTKP